MLTHIKRPAEPKLNEVLRLITRLGGFLGHKSDGDPGVKTVWLGLKEIHVRARSLQALSAGEEPYEDTGRPHARRTRSCARRVPDNLLGQLLPWLTQHRVPGDDEVWRALRCGVPEYQPVSAPTLQSVGAIAMCPMTASCIAGR